MTPTRRMSTGCIAAIGIVITVAVIAVIVLWAESSHSESRSQSDVAPQAERYLAQTLDAVHYTRSRVWESQPNVCSPVDTSHQSLEVGFTYPNSVPANQAGSTLTTIAQFWEKQGYGKATVQKDMKGQIVDVGLNTSGYELDANWQGGQLNIYVVTPCYTPSSTSAATPSP
jgi:hypothetical protein